MSIVIILILLILSTVLTVPGTILFVFGDIQSKHYFPMLLVFLVLAGWYTASINQPSKITLDVVLPISVSKETNGQVVGFKSEDGKYKVVNLNKVFGRVLPPDASIRVVELSSGPYYGLYHGSITQYILMSPNNQIIDVKQEDESHIKNKDKFRNEDD